MTMSMLFEVIRLSDEVRQELLRDPRGICKILDLLPETAATRAAAPRRNLLQSFLSLFRGTKNAPPPPPPPEPVEYSELIQNTEIDPSDRFDLDKTWHILHYLIGRGDGYSDIVFPRGVILSPEAESVGDIDVGYGPAQLYSPQQVKEIAMFLETLDPAEMKQRLVPARLDEDDIYPPMWKDSDLDTELLWRDIYENYFLSLKTFLREAADRDLAILEMIA